MSAVVERCARQEWKSGPMSKEVRHQFEVLVVGGGPAGLAAAVRAAEGGASVGIVDDNPKLGGEIWRGADQDAAGSDASMWLARLKARGVAVICGASVFDLPRPRVLLAEAETAVHVLAYSKLVLATGARERFLPFPGWSRRFAGNGEIRLAHSRKARCDLRNWPVAAGGRCSSAGAWSGDHGYLRASFVDKLAGLRMFPVAAAWQDPSRAPIESTTCGREVPNECLGRKCSWGNCPGVCRNPQQRWDQDHTL